MGDQSQGRESLFAADVQAVRDGLYADWRSPRKRAAEAALDRIQAVVAEAWIVSQIERTGTLPDFQPLADAFAAMEVQG